MLVKEKIGPPPADKLGRAGYDAEIQMAFYLRRAFAEAPDVFIFNDLRLERNGEAAQMDHLIMHRFGFVIVESKSVVGELVVNARGEFARVWNGKPRGIQSPIQQARLQAELLRRLLDDHKVRLRRKVLFGLKQGEFAEERFRVLVAVSDSGIIKREGIDLPELLKADSIADAIRAIIETHTRATGVGGFLRAVTADRKTAAELDKNQLIAFTDDEMLAIKSFLLERDTPAASPLASPANIVTPPPVQAIDLAQNVGTPVTEPILQETRSDAQRTSTCKQCNGDKLAIAYGRYGYYYKCQDCQGNTPIDLTCTACGKKARISKSGMNFRRVCKACGAEVPFHTNPPEVVATGS